MLYNVKYYWWAVVFVRESWEMTSWICIDTLLMIPTGSWCHFHWIMHNLHFKNSYLMILQLLCSAESFRLKCNDRSQCIHLKSKFSRYSKKILSNENLFFVDFLTCMWSILCWKMCWQQKNRMPSFYRNS